MENRQNLSEPTSTKELSEHGTMVAVVRLNSNQKDCFISVVSTSHSNLQKELDRRNSDDISNRVICLEKIPRPDLRSAPYTAELNKVYFSVSHISTSNSTTKYEVLNQQKVVHDENDINNSRRTSTWSEDSLTIVSLNNKFATNLGYSNDENVLLTFVNDVLPVEKGWIEPSVDDDWEILECNASKIESNFLNQLRIVQVGFSYFIFVSNLSISIKIVKLFPFDRTIGILQQHTELYITPKDRAKTSEQFSWYPDKDSIATTSGVLNDNKRVTDISEVQEPKTSLGDSIRQHNECNENMRSSMSTTFSNLFKGLSNGSLPSFQKPVEEININIPPHFLSRTWRVVPLSKIEGERQHYFCCFCRCSSGSSSSCST